MCKNIFQKKKPLNKGFQRHMVLNDRIERSSDAYHASVLPLNYIGIFTFYHNYLKIKSIIKEFNKFFKCDKIKTGDQL